MSGKPELWLVRHGETEWSRDHRHTGSRTDLPLTAAGEQAARALSGRLSQATYDLVLTSPLRRARHTARLAGFAAAEVEPDAREWDYGDYEGITTAEIRKARPGWTVWAGGAEGGEDAAAVGERADRVVERVRRCAPERALLFAHGHLLRVLAARWIDRPAAEGALYRLDTGSVSVLGWERETPTITRWNC